MTGAAVLGILVAAVGAILAYAVAVSPVQHGFDINTDRRGNAIHREDRYF